MRVLIATKNEAKIEGARRAFEKYFKDVEIEGISAESEVADQPVNEEIYRGAKNRVENLKKYAKENNLEADLFISIESGINNFFGKWMINNIAIIEDNNGFESCGLSSGFPVPNKYAESIISTDLNKVINNIFGEDEKRHTSGGAISLLTNGKITRIDLTMDAFIMALTKYINKDKWQ